MINNCIQKYSFVIFVHLIKLLREEKLFQSCEQAAVKEFSDTGSSAAPLGEDSDSYKEENRLNGCGGAANDKEFDGGILTFLGEE